MNEVNMICLRINGATNKLVPQNARPALFIYLFMQRILNTGYMQLRAKDHKPAPIMNKQGYHYL